MEDILRKRDCVTLRSQLCILTARLVKVLVGKCGILTQNDSGEERGLKVSHNKKDTAPFHLNERLKVEGSLKNLVSLFFWAFLAQPFAKLA